MFCSRREKPTDDDDDDDYDKSTLAKIKYKKHKTYIERNKKRRTIDDL